MGSEEEARAAWQRVLIDGHESLRMAQRLFRHLPSEPRCKLCSNPFGGFGGRLVGLAGFKPSRKNPNLCAKCCESLPPGGLEVDIAVLFADLRNSTALSEHVGPVAFAGLLNRFYKSATRVLLAHDAIIDKLIGDEVMALFVPGIAGPQYRRQAGLAGVELIKTLSKEPALPLGAAVDAGVAYVGNVGGEGVLDFTALGDPVNTAARLQAAAAAGELILSDEVYRDVRDEVPGAEPRLLTVRGRESPIAVHVVSPLTSPVAS